MFNTETDKFRAEATGWQNTSSSGAGGSWVAAMREGGGGVDTGEGG